MGEVICLFSIKRKLTVLKKLMTYNYFQLFRCGESADAQGCFVVSEYVFKIQFGCDQFYRVQEVTQQGYNHSVLLICKGYVGFQTCRVACDDKS